MNRQVQRENESSFPKNGLMACETLCQKGKVTVTKKQGILKKVGSLLPWQFSKSNEREMWSRTVCNCLPQDYCCITPKQSMEGTARYGDLEKLNVPSCWLWQFLSSEEALTTQPGERQLSECYLENALLVQHYHYQNQQTKNIFGKRCDSLVLTTRVAENWMEKSSLQHCSTFLVSTAIKILHQILWALTRWRHALKTLGGNYIFICLLSSSEVCSSGC